MLMMDVGDLIVVTELESQGLDLTHVPIGMCGNEEPRIATGLDVGREEARFDATIQVENVPLQRGIKSLAGILEAGENLGTGKRRVRSVDLTVVRPVSILPGIG